METIMNKRSRFYLSNKTRGFIVDVIVYLFVALFIYTAASKLMTIETFKSVLSGSPLIGEKFGKTVALLIPSVEILISFLLIIPFTRKLAFCATLALMTVFTGYLIYMVFSESNLPCSCGGVISKLSWQQHIWFNISFAILALTGLILYKT